MGLVLAVCVHAADVRHHGGARQLVDATAPTGLPALQLVWADQSDTGQFAEWRSEPRRWEPAVVRHPARQAWRYGPAKRPPPRSQVLRGRWIMARTCPWRG